MKKTLLALGLLVMSFSPIASAHVSNETSTFTDTINTSVKDDIVYLRSLNIVPNETGVIEFHPSNKMTKEDVAYYAASFRFPDPKVTARAEYAKIALEKKLVDSLEGNATYEDINKAFFDNKAQVPKTSDTPTREAFVKYMSQYYTTKVDGNTLFDMAKFKQGPSGKVEAVTPKKENDAEFCVLTIDGKEYTVTGHPKLLHAPVDLNKLVGKTIEQSWTSVDETGKETIKLISVKQGEFTDEEIKNQSSTHSHTDHTNSTVATPENNQEHAHTHDAAATTTDHANPDKKTDSVKEKDNSFLLKLSGFITGAVVVTIVTLLVRRKK